MTSVDNPLPVDRDTLYVLGSVTKTYTATALMHLAAAGQAELDAPVRRYVPELVLADEQTAAEVTVLNLLNHTSGLGWDILTDTGEGDDALARFVPKLAELELVAPLGARPDGAAVDEDRRTVEARVVRVRTPPPAATEDHDEAHEGHRRDRDVAERP